MAGFLKSKYECSLVNPTASLQELLSLFENKDSQQQVDRQLILLELFFASSRDGVQIADLQLLSKVMKILKDRATIDTRFRQPFHSVMELLKHPPKMDKSSDELNYKHFLVELYSTLGCLLLQTKYKILQSQILDIVEKNILAKRTQHSNEISEKTCAHAVEVSVFMDCLSDFLVVVDEDLYDRSVYMAFLMCSISEFSRWTLLINNVIEVLLVRLMKAKDDEKTEVVEDSYRLLWKLLNCTDHPADWLQVPTPSRLALRALRSVLRQESLNHNHPGDSTGLTNVSALLLRLMHLFPNAEYVSSGITSDIAFFATLSEAVLPLAIVPCFKNKFDHLQFKKLMLACLSMSPVCPASLETFKFHKVAECLVFMLGGDSSCGCPAYWSPLEATGLFQAALLVVNALFDCLRKAFIDAGLIETLVEYLKVKYLDEGSSFDDLTQKVLKTILLICFHKEFNETTCDAVRDSGVIPVLLQFCKIILKPHFSLATSSQSILCLSLCILTKLIKNNAELQKTHGDIFFLVVTGLYQRILKPLPTDSLIDNRLCVAVTDFAWETLIWNKENVLKFVRSGYIFTHIDIMEKSPYTVQITYLSMLVDLCEFYQSIPYIVAWRGREGVKLLSLLCKIWRAEEGRIGVARNEQGCISDIEFPLMGKTQSQLVKGKNKKEPISICDIFGSARPKIYAIVQLLSRHSDVAAICEEFYRLGHDKLPCEDQVTLQLIKAYFPLKLGEVWWEIKKNQDSVLPLDIYLAETLTERYLNWSLRVQHAQLGILRDEDTKLRQEEQTTYDILRSGQLTSALEALREVMTIARTADRQILLSSNRRIHEGILASRATVDTDMQVTYPRDLLVVDSNCEVVLNVGTLYHNTPPVPSS